LKPFHRKSIIKEWDEAKTENFKFFFISSHLGSDFSWFLCQQQKLREEQKFGSTPFDNETTNFRQNSNWNSTQTKQNSVKNLFLSPNDEKKLKFLLLSSFFRSDCVFWMLKISLNIIYNTTFNESVNFRNKLNTSI
jgi:hypothetical protein